MFSTPPAQPLIKTVKGNAVSFTAKVPFTVSVDISGKQQIRFSHCPWLTFPSMQYAFDYFHVQEKLHNQRAIQPDPQRRLQAAAQQGIQVAQRPLQARQQGYLATTQTARTPGSDVKAGTRKISFRNSPSEQANLVTGEMVSDGVWKKLERNTMQEFAAQQACFAETQCPSEPVWQFDTPLKPINAQYTVNLPQPRNHNISGSQYQHTTEPLSQNRWEEPDQVHNSSRASPLGSPPQTLFAESTPHAQEIRARPRLRLAVKGLQPWPFQSQATKDDAFLQSPSSRRVADHQMTLPGSHHQTLTCIGTGLPQSVANKIEIFDHSSNFHASYSLPASYADTVLPQTLNRKDRRVLGVPLSASIDE